MTGFSRQQGHSGDKSWVWEIKSVNGKSLDVRFRTPPGLEALEQGVRTICAERLRRGNISVGLQISTDSKPMVMQINREALRQLLDVVPEIAREFGAEPPRVDGLLSVRGVIEHIEPEETETEREAREAAMLESFAVAVDSLKQSRLEEGRKLETVMRDLVDELEGLAQAAAGCAAAQPEALRQRLKEQVARLIESDSPLPEERLIQEAALLAAKADIREEIDRISAHVGAARNLLDDVDDGPVGRRLDFLSQEFNREANTICSKSSDIELTRIGLDMKTAIDRFREQCQNIE
jgi:uncharacterized protein (TIGR00255 family)